MLQSANRLRTPRLHLAHMRNVKHPNPVTNRLMLGTDPLILKRHLPSSERDQPRASRHMSPIQRRAAQYLGVDGHLS